MPHPATNPDSPRCRHCAGSGLRFAGFGGIPYGYRVSCRECSGTGVRELPPCLECDGPMTRAEQAEADVCASCLAAAEVA